MNKAEIVIEINKLDGPVVTVRARKDTLLEILRERQNAAAPKKAPLYLGAKAPRKPKGFFEWLFGA